MILANNYVDERGQTHFSGEFVSTGVSHTDWVKQYPKGASTPQPHSSLDKSGDICQCDHIQKFIP